ncbi:MAG: hypothetical protein ABH950_01800, partial [Candidatus Altiarchaeota archaeon]
MLEVVFPDGTHYPIIPDKDPNLYASKYVLDKTVDEWAKLYGGEPVSLAATLKEQLEKHIETLKALIIDYKNMDRVDVWFTRVFLGQPLIKDLMVARRQASKELWDKFGPKDLEEILRWDPKKQNKMLDLERKISARTIELLREGQVLEIEKQLPFWENFLLEETSSALIGGVADVFFTSLLRQLKRLKNFTDVPVIGKIIKSAITEATDFRTVELAKQIDIARRHAKSIPDKVGVWGLDIWKRLIDEIDFFTQFWKDTVLIFASGTAIRNMMDNTMKACNEMINSTLVGRPFWALMRTKKRSIVDIPPEVAKESWAKYIADLPGYKQMEAAGVDWWTRFRQNLYDSLLSGPEQAARKWLYAGKLKQIEKELLKQGHVGKDFYNMAKEMAIEEVNRVFFDYSKRMQIEVGLSRIAPFETYNVRNFAYWLKDFYEHPWKLPAIRSIWHWWQKQSGTDVSFNIKRKVPTYLIPGVYFDPMSWMSPFKFFKVFVLSSGNTEWWDARDRHIRWQIQLLKSIPPHIQKKILSNSEQKSIQDYLDRQKYKWVKVGVDTFEEWLGLFPLWRKALEQLQLAEKQPWKKMFPQSRLLERPTQKVIEYLGGQVKPISKTIRHQIYTIMDAQGIPSREEIQKEIQKQVAAMPADQQARRNQLMRMESNPQRRARELIEHKRAVAVLKPAIAEKIYWRWEMQKNLIGYFTGLYLTKSYAEIAKMH